MLPRLLTAALVAAVGAGPAVAQDAQRGASLATPCLQCHGARGRSQMETIPSLAGQPADFIIIQMILLREGLRQAPAMAPFAANLADRDIEDLAAYFTALPPGPPDDRGPRDAALVAVAEAMVGPRHCVSCHVADFGGRNQIPRIAAQREEYLVHVMTQYRDGTRAGPDTQMNDAVKGLSDAQIAALAHFLAQRD